jgi:hypothetical protein
MRDAAPVRNSCNRGLGEVAMRERVTRSAQAAVILCGMGLAIHHLVHLMLLADAHTWPMVLAGLAAGAFAADFISGLVHWACDTFGSEETPLIGSGLIKSFREHHRDPGLMLSHDWIEVNYQAATAACAAFLLLTLPAAQDFLSLHVFGYGVSVSMIGLSIIVNQLHKWAHTRQPPRPVAWLQRCRLVLSLHRHARHHRAPHTDRYCIATGWTNEVLDGMGFWRALERLVRVATGAEPYGAVLRDRAARCTRGSGPQQEQKSEAVAGNTSSRRHRGSWE